MNVSHILPLKSRFSALDREVESQPLRTSVTEEKKSLPPCFWSSQYHRVCDLFKNLSLSPKKEPKNEKIEKKNKKKKPDSESSSAPIDPNTQLFQKIFHSIEGDIKEEPKIAKTSRDDTKNDLDRKRQILLEPSDRVLQTEAADILGRTQAISNPLEAIIEESTWDDLNLFRGDRPHTLNMIQQISLTGTQTGNMYERGLVARPTNNIATLQTRQELIKALQSTGIGNEMYELLHKPEVQNGERQLLHLWDPRIEYPGAVSKLYYRYFPSWNESPLALDLGTAMSRVNKIVKVAWPALLATACAVNAGAGLLGYSSLPWITKHAEKLIGTGKHGLAFQFLTFIPCRAAKIAGNIGAAGSKISGIFSELPWIPVDYAIDSMLYQKFYRITTFCKAMQEIAFKIANHPEIETKLAHSQDLKTFFENKEIQALFQVMNAASFQHEAAFFYRRGQVLYLLHAFEKPLIREQFEKALVALGEIDTFVSAAKLVENSANQRVQFTFPNYVEGSRHPILHLENFWNVFVDPARVQTNSIHFSPDNPVRCHLITGPNGGGKTTILRSIVTSIVMSQTLGIAPASLMTLTPFTYTACSMNVADIQGEASHFEAECDRVKKINDRQEMLASHEFGFIVLDELFSGAAQEQSSFLSRVEAQKLAQKENLLSLIVTHDANLPTLEKESPVYKNYQVLIGEDRKPLFQLREGISKENIALEVARKRCFTEPNQIQNLITTKV